MSRPRKYDPYDTIVKKTLDRRIPFKVDWEVTYQCNERCLHCYQPAQPGLPSTTDALGNRLCQGAVGPGADPSREKELDTREAMAVLDQLAELGCLYITFTGGEILTRPDFFDVARYAKKKGFALRLFSNGTLIDAAAAEKMKELCPLSVEVSLYALDPSLHENITGVPGSFAGTRAGLALLKERGIPTVIKCTAMQLNWREIDGLKAFASENGFGFSSTFTVIPKVDASRDVTVLRLHEEELFDIFSSEPSYTEGIAYGGVKNYKPLCAAGFNSLYISPYGEVYPCVALRESCGNVRKTSLAQIWQSPVLEKIRKVGFEDLKECRECKEASYCDRCAGVAWMETGDMLGVSPHDCVLARVRRDVVERGEHAVLARVRNIVEKREVFHR